MGDRSGGREPKGASLKKSKKNPGAPAAKTKKVAKAIITSTISSSAPMPNSDRLYFDCGAALLSRQFDKDRDRVLGRGQNEGNCIVILNYFNDIEKQTQLYDLCKLNSGYCYYVTGIHPDNIDRTNKKSHESWIEKIEDLAKRPECIGLLTGLNLTREMGTHFAQETLFKAICEMSIKLLLPVILHLFDSSSLDRCLELLHDIGWINDSCDIDNKSNHRVLIHDGLNICNYNIEKVHSIVQAGLNVIISGSGITDSDINIKTKAINCLKAIPLDRIHVCSDSPWKTPQNLPDLYLRTLRNEPSNIPYVVKAISEGLLIDEKTIALSIRSNSLQVFGLETIDTSYSNNHTANSEQLEERDDQVDKSIHKVVKLTKSDRDKEILRNVNELIESKPIESSADIADEVCNNLSNLNLSENDDNICYLCQRCRLQIFSFRDITNHSNDTLKTIFKVGEIGLCKSTIFLSNINIPTISIQGTIAECSECHIKLGKYSLNESTCACGAIVNGPTIRINSSKIDQIDKSLNTLELLARSKLENENLISDDDINEKKEKKVRSKKKIASSNKGNFSNYRNKSFRPNASRNKGDEIENDNVVDSQLIENTDSDSNDIGDASSSDSDKD